MHVLMLEISNYQSICGGTNSSHTAQSGTSIVQHIIQLQHCHIRAIEVEYCKTWYLIKYKHLCIFFFFGFKTFVFGGGGVII